MRLPSHRLRQTGPPSLRWRSIVVCAVAIVSSCTSTDAPSTSETSESSASPSASPSTSPILTPTPTTVSVDVPATTSAPAPTTTTIVPATTTTLPVPTTTLPPRPTPGPADTLDLAEASMVIGTSFEGRPIEAERIGAVGGRRVLVVGVIHGNEDAGVAILDELRNRAAIDGVELWLVPSMNPDGQVAQRRQNANGVDLNRNFPHDWGPIGSPGDSQYAGPTAASEPETQTMVAFIQALRPDIAIWYHQDANLVIPSTGRDGRIRARYAELTGLPIADCCGGGAIYTGIAATWARVELKRDSDAVPFIVELPGGDLTPEQVTAHADAVTTIATEG